MIGGQHEVEKALVPDMSDWVPLWTKMGRELLEYIIEAVAVHRACGIINLICVPARRLAHRQA